MKRNRLFHILTLSVLISGFLASCTTVDVFEKNVAIPNHAWSSQFKPSVSLDINDTTSLYNIYLVIRHTDAYRYKNIWVNVTAQPPAGSPTSQSLELQLATDSKGWLGTGMDDIFEHRILITPAQKPILLKKGTYQFTIANIMREDPLQHVMNVGIRVEKAK
ncbi:MAG: gliding motility lipoprotein GldH [Niastella sp.]|nr:gliding motility lipoprotein GldH [Niastella sp.]